MAYKNLDENKDNNVMEDDDEPQYEPNYEIHNIIKVPWIKPNSTKPMPNLVGTIDATASTLPVLLSY